MRSKVGCNRSLLHVNKRSQRWISHRVGSFKNRLNCSICCRFRRPLFFVLRLVDHVEVTHEKPRVIPDLPQVMELSQEIRLEVLRCRAINRSDPPLITPYDRGKPS
jgi:hypothetical protein